MSAAQVLFATIHTRFNADARLTFGVKKTPVTKALAVNTETWAKGLMAPEVLCCISSSALQGVLSVSTEYYVKPNSRGFAEVNARSGE
jgi:hypothetical protein